MITTSMVESYRRDGAVCVRNAFSQQWLDQAGRGIERNLASPSEYASENAVAEGEGRFFDDYVNWRRIPEFEDIVRNSPAAELAARIMDSSSAQFFHDHVLIKEPGTPKPTPWHQDAPYYLVEGTQTVSMWMPLEPVGKSTLRFIAGSHLWERMVRPVSWADDTDYYDNTNSKVAPGALEWAPVPDPDGADSGEMRVIEWTLEPGDVVFFHFRTCHGARGNAASTRRRALSLRWVGDDARYVERPGRPSPPFPNHGMRPGEKLREDWFPVIYTSTRASTETIETSKRDTKDGARNSQSRL